MCFNASSFDILYLNEINAFILTAKDDLTSDLAMANVAQLEGGISCQKPEARQCRKCLSCFIKIYTVILSHQLDIVMIKVTDETKSPIFAVIYSDCMPLH